MPQRCHDAAPPLPRFLIALILHLSCAASSFAGGDAAFKVAPGPAVMSEEEKAIVADPDSGAQHGVILIEETERDDSITGMARTSYHLRAKIISAEARDLANVEIPFDARSGYLTEWWGRTILPDGAVLELKKADLRQQEVVQVRGVKATVLRGALPGVMPGCVVDYGYVYRDESFRFYFDVPLQRPWKILRSRYRWMPVPGMGGRYQLRRRTTLAIDVKTEKQSIFIEASDLPPVAEEPYMPPKDVVTAGVTFYYPQADHTMAADPNLFWNEVAESEEEDLRAFIRKNQSIKDAIASMGLRPDATLEEKLRSAYDWILASITNLADRTTEDRETAAERDWKKVKNTAEYVLTTREGWGRQLDRLFVGFARELGAEANVVLAPDRSSRYWNKEFLSAGQLHSELVVVRAPGKPVEESIVVDVSSGMPFGEFDWRNAPTKALLVTARGAQEFVIRGSDARGNQMTTTASIAPADEEGGARVLWSAAGMGQRGVPDRWLVRRASSADERRKLLEDLCGSGGDFEVAKAELPGYDKPLAPFKLECEGDLQRPDSEPDRDEHALRFDGPWIPPVPLFAASTRVHPIVFDYPWIDLTSIEMSAPPGYGPADPPQPTRIESPFGSYVLKISALSNGYRVERAFALVATTLKVEAYEELRGYLEAVRRADRTPLHFRRDRPEAASP